LDDEICHSPVECSIWEDGVGLRFDQAYYSGLVIIGPTQESTKNVVIWMAQSKHASIGIEITGKAWCLFKIEIIYKITCSASLNVFTLRPIKILVPWLIE